MERQTINNAAMEMHMQENGMEYIMDNSEIGMQEYVHGYMMEEDTTEKIAGQEMQMQFQGNYSAAEDEAPVYYGAAVANDSILTPAFVQENRFASQVVGWEANATELDDFTFVYPDRPLTPNNFIPLAALVQAAIIDHDLDRPFDDIIWAPIVYFTVDFTSHTASEEELRGTQFDMSRISTAVQGLYYNCVNGLGKPLRDLGHPNIDLLDRYSAFQVEKFLTFANLYRQRLEHNQRPLNASFRYTGATCKLMLWDTDSSVGRVRHGRINAYKEFVARMEPVIRSCANVFRQTQPYVYDEAIRLRNACVGEPAVDRLPQLAQNCFETVRIVANCAFKPRQLSKTRPWTVILVLGNHMFGGGFTLFMDEGDQRWGGLVTRNSSASDILIVNNEFEVGNIPFVTDDGASMYLLQFSLPRMGHEFDII
ncbi:uncharacterized protein Bfra_011750 [Botrytis fragariae]|uniref:Uncharacterized protein n=1 Tax=Botrytis fragariae TaxID=1964551 RepID=A0A8H6EED1_9HELO|nr:uncharacterized protein Bfra_011750 [Botrytis fragariae]KAF5869207.1 hypothetical protein Bfra_011750 [Botrytis fragariae]